ncbi:DUF3616 domain-containing protein [Methylobacterium sp. Leaf91]|uniref:DUF3616 domain-containing protein n=1 Tax=Methylobacterium sp. Leaf91 TaxID=1736247 RepID=UPI0006FA3AF4|nr:DUF3616 domain-containing protein [Methylobacterium sp. Leaf91]KQO86389.1 hypothetical protein ASF32_07690 [Methylobacterium sp. Leaf91]
MTRTGLLAMLLLHGAAAPALAAGGAQHDLVPVDPPYTMTSGLKGKDGKPAKDISGIACMPPREGKRRCLVVNDENTGAQFITIDGHTITPGADIDLVGGGPSPNTLGTPPSKNGCSGGEGKFDDLDGEGVAYAAPYFYVVGSHGCSRGKAKFKLSTFVLARIKVDAAGEPVGPSAVETTYRLGDALGLAETVSAYYTQDLQTDDGDATPNGLNIEGVAVDGTRLFAGLRAPSHDGKTFIVEADVGALFAQGHESLMAAPQVIPLMVGRGAGIRDLAILPDGRLLVLTGPAQGQTDVPYSLFAAGATTNAKLEPIGRLTGAEKGAKAEGVAVLGDKRILVMFDSVKDGGPLEYKLP